jgi:RNA polymerase sigma factor (TIGR02999 family)
MTEPPFTTSVYRELHALAAIQLSDQKANHTLQPTALVNEAYLRIAKLKEPGAAGRKQFYALAGKVMRSVLVDHARKRKAAKRQGGQQIELSTSVAGPQGRPIDVLALNDAVERLQELDPQLVHIADLLLFAGMTAAEAADILGVSSRTVERGWRTARAFLRQALGGDAGPGKATP